MAERMNKEEASEENSKELEILKMYLEEVKTVPPVKPGEKEELLGAYANGRKEVRNRIMELYLMDTLQIASEYREQGIGLSDLIQEANMGLVLALEEMVTDDLQIKKRIRTAVEAALAEEGRAGAIGEHVAEEINRLDEASQALTERSGQAPTIEELMEYLGMPEDELREYMSISLNAINAGLAE